MGTNHDSLEQPDPVLEDGEGSEGDDNMEDSSDSSTSSGFSSSSGSDACVGSSSSSSDSDSEDDTGPPKKENNKKEEEEEEVDEDDPVIKAIVKAKEKKCANRPPDITLEAIPSTICFHPVEDRLIFGNYEGQILMYGYSLEKNVRVAECEHKPHSVRAITFNHDGRKLIGAYSDQTIKLYDVEKQLKLERTIEKATPAPISSIYVIDENVFATGDDDGNVLLWDNRANCSATTSLRLGEDAITSMVSNDDRRILVCTSEEGAIYAVKIRGGKVQVESEIYDYEFNCSCVFKQESKLAVGDGKGDVYIFNWDEFGKHSDICKGIGKGEAIQAMIPITERIILCGGDDGFIRAFNFFPQKYLGVVGKLSHPVEKMDVCNDGHLIASLGADETVKFWNVSYFENMTIGEPSKEGKKGEQSSSSNGGGGGKQPTKSKPSSQKQDLSKNNLPSSSHQNKADFFKGLATDD